MHVVIAVAADSHSYFHFWKQMAGTITALKFQKKNKERANVYLDGRYAFSLAVTLAARLKKGQVLSEEEIEGLLAEDGFHKAYERALRFLSYRPRSQMEVRRYLQGKKVPPTIEDKVVERLTGIGLLDDLAFARYWVENRERFKPRSLSMLRYELRNTGLSAEIIALVLGDLNEEESAYAVAVKQARRLSHLDYPAFRSKVTPYLRRRGFPYEVINTTVKRAWQEVHGEGAEMLEDMVDDN
jgi:regulatory protein